MGRWIAQIRSRLFTLPDYSGLISAMTCSALTHYIPYDLRSGFDVLHHCLDHSRQKRVAGESRKGRAT